VAYNTYTKLLLKFNEGNGSTTTSDSSQGANGVTLAGSAVISSANGKFSTNSLITGDPGGSGSVGGVSVNSPGSIFSSSTSSEKRFDLFFYRDASPPWGIQPLVSITFQNGDTFLLWRGSTSYEVEINSTNTNGDYTYQSYTDYNGYQTWVHLRLAVADDVFYVGLDGSQVLTGASANSYDLWAGGAGNPVTEFLIGRWPTAFGADSNVFARGYIDAYEVLEGDTSWFGGSYTVPTAEPDSYTGGGGNVNVSLTGQSFSVDHGSLVANAALAISGQAYSYAQGTLTPQVGSNVSVGLTGQAYGYAQGSLGNARTRALTGQAYSYSQGVITPVVGVTVALTGQALSFAQGTTGCVAAIPVAGQATNYQQGALSTETSVSVSGQSHSYSQGIPQANRSKTLAGQAFSISQGGLYTGTPLVGSNTVEDVVSTGVGGDPPNHYDLYTTLMLHFNSGGLLEDSSLYNQTVIENSGCVVSLNTATPLLGTGSADFATSNTNGLDVVPGGIFFDSTTDKVIDIIYKPVSRAGTNQNIFYVTFPGSAYNGGGSCYIALEVDGTNGKMYLTVRTPTMRVISTETTAVVTYGSANYIRLAFINDHCYLCRNGTQLLNLQTDFGGDVWPNSSFNKLQIGLYAYGLMDCYRIQEGGSANHGYTGGNYTPFAPTSEWYPDARTAVGANTTEAIASSGAGLVLPEIEAEGANTLDDMLGEGNTNVGEWREAVGSIVLDDVTSVGDGNTLPVIAAAGASTTEAFASQGIGYLEWIGRGENTLEAFTGTGAGELKNFNEGAGVSVTSVSSSGVGFVAVSCAGENETSVTSAGDGIINAYMVGESETSVSSVGEGFLIRFIDQWNTTTSVSSSGEAIAFFDAVGSSVAEVLSVGYGECQITGQGQSTAFVETYAGIPVGLLEAAVLEYAHSKPDVVYVR